ncbi:MAG: aspartate kinase [Salinivenus sp.]
MESPHVVYKFGGTSVGTAPRFRTVVEILRRTAQEGRGVGIVSAQGKVTRRLSAALESFATQINERPAVVDAVVRDLRTRHRSQARKVLGEAAFVQYMDIAEERLQALRALFAEAEREGITPALRDAVLATGEQLSVPMVTLALRDAGCAAPFCDATALVVTDETFGEATVDLEATRARLRNWYEGLSADAVPVVAGFIGATSDGRTTTLGFEGSDYSAALFARILTAGCLTRYTDVDGLYSADPETDPTAERLDRLSMKEALARTEAGRLGMHPKTLRPLVDAGIPMQVRSIDEPDGEGTQIVPEADSNVSLVPPVGHAAPTTLP